ncbi:reverse transcriptase [Gossypium australe]|uniref:Reverse transcriptase n=1 Tax=Gossypium australe TaxID=47621 RepID=A0A5B6W9G2_9ROSI|nr:reverse transcriptase [Gossypium australe]
MDVWCISMNYTGEDTSWDMVVCPLFESYTAWDDVTRPSHIVALANRFRKTLRFCIEETQGAFVPSRQIIDNILLAYELLHSFKKNSQGLKDSQGYLILRKGRGKIEGVKVGRSGLPITHILFTGDKEALAIKTVVNEYEAISGQMVNFDKSLIYFSNNIRRDLGVRIANNLEKYLGLLTMVGRRKKTLLKIFDKSNKLEHSQPFHKRTGGFIKSVLQVIPLFAMQLESIWQNLKTNKGIHWCSWKFLCSPKEHGGIGFRDLSNFNKAFLAKQGWKLITDPNCLLAQVMKATYYPRRNHPSFIWRSIWGIRNILESGVGWRIGDGKPINIWNDTWLPYLGNKNLQFQNINWRYTTVEELINPTILPI